MELKHGVVALLHFLDVIEHKVILGIPFDYEEEYILNDLVNQLRDSRSVLELEKRYKSNK